MPRREGSRESGNTATHFNNPDWLMPRDAYVSEAWFRREQATLLSRSWNYVGVAGEFQAPGDYICTRVGLHPLVVVKGRDGRLRALHNLCRHRGAPLLEDRGNIGGKIVCPYHRWAYGLDGGLKGVPCQDVNYPELRKSDYGLLPAAVARFRGLVFAHPDPAADFSAWIGELEANAWPFDIDDLECMLAVHYGFRCNWKLAMENALDTYHLAFLHKAGIGAGPSGDPRYFLRPWRLFQRHACQIRDSALFADGRDLDYYISVDPPLAHHAEFNSDQYLLFPNLFTGAFPGGLIQMHVTPHSVERCEVVFHYCVAPHCEEPARRAFRNAIRSLLPGTELVHPDHTRPWTIRVDSLDRVNKPAMETGEVTLEDMWMMERLQRSMHAPQVQIGPLSPLGEAAQIKHFHRSVLTALDEAA